MRIQVKQVDHSDQECTRVSFSSAVGNGVGRWAKNQTEPKQGVEYDVEINVDASIEWERNARTSSTAQFTLLISATGVMLSGQVDSKDDDGMIYFRLAPDCLIMIESEEERMEPGSWISLELAPEEIELWPLGG